MANQEGGLGHQPDDYFIPPDVRGSDDDKEVTNPHFEYPVDREVTKTARPEAPAEAEEIITS